MTQTRSTHAADLGVAISPVAFEAAMSPFAVCGPVAVAVSGGADSMGLALLAQSWAAARGFPLTALTVDHRLRPDSSAEAIQVHEWLSARGFAHHILEWAGGDAVRHLARSAQDAARDARYELLTKWCRAHGAAHLLLAHHADDQIETFFMRLARGSGVQGLGGMDAKGHMRGVALLRPLLDFSKADLIATCEALGQPWVDDPSNTNAKYARSRFRQARAFLEAEGLTPARLRATIANLQRARDAIAHAVDALHGAACLWSAYGAATLSARKVLAAPDEVALRLLSDVLRAAGGQMYGPRFDALQRLHAKLKGEDVKAVTLHGCCIAKSGEVISIFREPSAIRETKDLIPGDEIIWDGRFAVSATADAAGLMVRPYRVEDKAWWATQGDIATLEDIPSRLRRGLPVMADAAGPVAMPHAGLWRADAAGMAAFVTIRLLGPRSQENSGSARDFEP